MPFTLSHVALVLPFSRPLARWRLLSATIIGSMVPDFGFLSPWRPLRIDTHGPLALLTFCLPVGLAVFWIFQRLIKTPIMEVLPDAAYARWTPYAAAADIGSLKQWIAAAAGILAGALTHLVWDGFTHEGARGVRMIPALDESGLDIAGHHLIGVHLMQDVSSVIGLAVVAAVLAYQLRPMTQGGGAPSRTLSRRERVAWVLAYLATAFTIGAGALLLRHSVKALTHSSGLALQLLAIATLRGLLFALLGVGVCLGLRLRRRALR